MTNPNNAVGTNAAYGGRTSVNAFNDDLSAYSRGVLSGWACAPSSGLTVALGGNGTTRDVAVAEDVTGNKTSINNISGAPIEVTIDAAPASNSRIDVIVAYVDSTLQGSATVTDNYGVCGLITVSGTASASPSAPSESAIRSAITADGAAGATAYYVVLAKITIASGTTDLTASNISAGDEAKITSDKLDFATLLYTGRSGTSGSITLNDDVSNYSYVTIFFCRSASPSRRSSVTVSGDANSCSLSMSFAGSDDMTIYSTAVTISGNSITFGVGRALALNSSGRLVGWGSSNELAIESVVGYNI